MEVQGPVHATKNQYVKFSFFKVEGAWRAVAETDKRAAREEFAGLLAKFGESLIIRTYSTVGTRGDCDFLVWAIGDSVEEIQALHAAINATRLGRHLALPWSFLAVTRRSQYVRAHTREDPSGHGSMRTIVPGDGKYLFVYPFWKTADWYQLPAETRQELMNEHFKIGHRYPKIKIHTTYSFGLDDPEFVLAFEGDDPSEFVDCVMELRQAKQRPYTLRDTPVLAAVRAEPLAMLKQLG